MWPNPQETEIEAFPFAETILAPLCQTRSLSLLRNCKSPSFPMSRVSALGVESAVSVDLIGTTICSVTWPYYWQIFICDLQVSILLKNSFLFSIFRYQKIALLQTPIWDTFISENVSYDPNKIEVITMTMIIKKQKYHGCFRSSHQRCSKKKVL